MSDDREDGPLGFDVPEDDRWAHRLDPDLAAERATGIPAVPPPPPPQRSRYGWLVGIAAVVLIAWVTLNSIATSGPGASGLDTGGVLPDFAAPLVLSDLDGDANVARRALEGSRAACQVRGPDILNVCELRERGPVVLAFIATSGDECASELDELDRLRPRFPGVQFAAVAVLGDRGDRRELVRDHGWGFPVAWDRDGAVSNIYGVAGCPTIVLASWPQGRIRRTLLGRTGEARLSTELQRLVERSRANGWRGA